MHNIGRALIVRGYRKLQPWLEAIEQEETARGGTSLVPGLHHFPSFVSRLTEETARAERYQLEFGLVVFQVPLPQATKRQRRELEIALRDCLRKADVPARLSENMLAVLLPQTGPGTAAAAERIGRLLSQVVGCPVTSGYACFPGDGQKASDLVRVATEHSNAAPLVALNRSGDEPAQRRPRVPATANS